MFEYTPFEQSFVQYGFSIKKKEKKEKFNKPLKFL